MDHLHYQKTPSRPCPRMVVGFGGWMDGGSVSTGTVGHIISATDAEEFAAIDPLEFYILNFPVTTIPAAIISDGEHTVLRPVNPMEQAALFRPHARIEDGLVRRFSHHSNAFHCSEDAGLVLFTGEEPHTRWRTFADCMFSLGESCGVREIFFVGSVASPIPHTRDPRMRASFSSAAMRDRERRPGIGLSSYEGPASFVTLLTDDAEDRGMEMRSLVVEIPHYPFFDIPTYPAGILRCLSVLTELMDLDIDLAEIASASAVVRQKLDEIMEENAQFAELVHKLEQAYDVAETTSDEELLRRLIDGLDLRGDNGHES